MRTRERSGLLLAAVTTAALYAPGALAQDGGVGGSGGGGPLTNCDPTTLWCSNGMMPDAHEAVSKARLPTGVDTGWMPSCAAEPPNCDRNLAIRAQIAFDPPKTGGPIYKIGMGRGAYVDVRWGESTDYFLVSLAKGRTNPADGKLEIRHTLTPEFALYVNALSINTVLALDASTLMAYLPGGQFNYLAFGTTKFPAWGFDRANATVKGTDLSNSQLFAVTFEDLGKLVGSGGFNDYVTGSFSFNAVTNSQFSYQTTKVVVGTADAPITSPDMQVRVPMIDADSIELMVHAEGLIRYEGTIEVLPVIHITSIGGIDGITLDFPISVGLDFEYQNNAVPAVFQAQMVEVPLPNVWATASPKDFGKVKIGERSQDQKILIENTGKLGAMLEFESTDKQFQIGGGTATTMGPDGDTYELKVRFQPTKSGKQQAEIIIRSNDPDTPEQRVAVYGYGEGEDIPEYDAGTGGAGGENQGEGGAGGTDEPDPEEDAGTDNKPATVVGNSDEDSGCGCRVPASQGSAGGAALALAALGLALRYRRRH